MTTMTHPRTLRSMILLNSSALQSAAIQQRQWRKRLEKLRGKKTKPVMAVRMAGR